MSSLVRAVPPVSVSALNMLAIASGGAAEVSREVFIGCSLEGDMAHTFSLESDLARHDAVQFLERAARVNNSSARLIADGPHLQVYVGLLFPRGLLDTTPTVLGLRVFRLAEPSEFDVVVPIESLVHRLQVGTQQGEAATRVPAEVASLQWAAITPPREGWRRRLGVNSEALRTAAAQGIKKVAEAVPESIGESILQKVRSDVWGAMIPDHKRIPAGAAFAADALGFVTEGSLQVHTVDNWVRLSSRSGYVLVKYAGGHNFGDDYDEG
jgi:hypothetical protein